MKRYISAIIFWGALWGLEEATIGHLLHITAFNIGWLLWFPLAYFFMGMVYKQTGKQSSILFSAVIAATIKLVDLFMTINSVIVICPALSILLESVSLFAVLKLVDRNKHMQKSIFPQIVSVSLLWRALFLVSLLFIPTWIMASYPYKSVSSILNLLLHDGLINSLLIYGIIILAKKIEQICEEKDMYFKQFTQKLLKSKQIKDLCFQPLVSLSILAIALIVQWML